MNIEEIAKIVILAVISYFLIKSVADDKLNNIQVLIIVALIMLAGSIVMYEVDCDKKKKEGFQSVVEYRTPSAFHGHGSSYPDNVSDMTLVPHNIGEDEFAPSNSDYSEYSYEDPDIRDMKDIMGINKKLYQSIVRRDKDLKDSIRSRHRYEMKYTRTNPLNTIPLGAETYGYTFLPPENWFRGYERPPVCISNESSNFVPVLSNGVESLLSFDTHQNTKGPLGIDPRYVRQVLNKQYKNKYSHGVPMKKVVDEN